MTKVKAWVEAMRLRTLPVSVAGVIAGVALSMLGGCFRWQPAAICLAFAVPACKLPHKNKRPAINQMAGLF